MENIISTIAYFAMIALGSFQLYRTYRFYKWDKENKQNALAPAVIYYGGYFGLILVALPLIFMTETTNLQLGHSFYWIIGVCIMLVSLFIFKRGRQMSKKLKQGESNLNVVQVYVIASVLFFTGFVNLFK